MTTGGEWVLEVNVIALHSLSGDHSGKNLGHYVVGLCGRVGLTGHEATKVRENR